MDEKLGRAINANETSAEALASARSAHHRLNKIEDGKNGLAYNARSTANFIVSTYVQVFSDSLLYNNNRVHMQL